MEDNTEKTDSIPEKIYMPVGENGEYMEYIRSDTVASNQKKLLSFILKGLIAGEMRISDTEFAVSVLDLEEIKILIDFGIIRYSRKDDWFGDIFEIVDTNLIQHT